MASEAAKDQKPNEKIIQEFQLLRNEQRSLVNNLNTLEMDLKEHKTVIETLKLVGDDRKCFRLIGGVLCERTVKDVLPQLLENKEFIEKTITVINQDLSKKGQQINKFKQDHNIRIRGEQMPDSKEDEKKSDASSSSSNANRNVLVSN
ncbi:probable prefoldin subunit 2 [Episyrphus balteatus]|uniref:probable prefoldin subunit 2 n=1 Tax=Episyrphus balteatus TaxID=286459 RepID=UPI002485C10B|nr:probable prefoldin subunit 2 [Episyrphus balteatus]